MSHSWSSASATVGFASSQLAEIDDRVRLADQLSQQAGPVILINTFRVAPEDADARRRVW